MAKKRNKKRLRLALWSVALVVIAAGILCWSRWGAWFGNPPEEAYTTPNTIDRVTLTPGAYFATQRTVSWRCGEELQDSWLEYSDGGTWRALPALGKVVETRSGRGCYYTASLHGLRSGSTVRYRLRTGRITSEVYTFEMPKGLEERTRFIYLGDVQDPSGAMSKSLFSILKGEHLPALKPHFIAAAGDQIEGPTDEYWSVWYEAWGATTPATLPMILATGNHEYLKCGFARELDPRWIPQYNYPGNGPEGFAGRTYYVDFPLMRFIVLDTTDLNDPIDLVRSCQWLGSVLRSSAQPWQIVMMHHAVETVREGRYNLLVNLFVDPVLRDNGADLVLQGHDHAYSRITTKEDGGALTTPVYVISTSSPKTYRNEFAAVHDRIASGIQLLQDISVTKEAIVYRSLQYNGDLYDHLTIRRKSADKNHNEVIDHAQGIPELFLFNGFGSTAKGRKKALQYESEVQARRERKAAH